MRYALLSTLFALTLLLPSAVSAQALPINNAAAFTLSVNPKYPAPYSQATLSLVSSEIDLPSAMMVVAVAGKEIYRGNVQPVAIPLGKAGGVVNVAVTIVSAGKNYSQTIAVQPQDVVLIAEPSSSAPPLYPGKPLVPLEGDVRVVAMANLRGANGKAINPSTYAYAWTVDDTQIASASGIGKSVLLVASPLVGWVGSRQLLSYRRPMRKRRPPQNW